MTPHTDQEITELHRRLYELCGKPALRPTYNDITAWQRFLFEMRPLEDAGDLAGRFEVRDLVAVMIRRDRERAKGAGWSIWPSKILQEPDKFRDMVLEERATARRSRPRPQPKRISLTAGDTTVEVDHDPVADADAAPLSNAMAEFLAANNLPPA